jgi:hypothetical protein
MAMALPGTPVSFWLAMPVGEFLEWATRIMNRLEKQNYGRQKSI